LQIGLFNTINTVMRQQVGDDTMNSFLNFCYKANVIQRIEFLKTRFLFYFKW